MQAREKARRSPRQRSVPRRATGPAPVMVGSPVLRTLAATRYVTPLREGGSLPAIVEAEDDGLYVVKFRGAGQGAAGAGGRGPRRGDRPGARAAGAGARAGDARPGHRPHRAGRRDPRPPQGQRGPEPRRGLPAGRARVRSGRVQPAARGARRGHRLVRRPGAQRGPDPAQPEPARVAPAGSTASTTGRACTCTTTGPRRRPAPRRRSPRCSDHVLLPVAGDIRAAGERLRPRLSAGLFRDARRRRAGRLARRTTPTSATRAAQRHAYVEWLSRRLAASAVFEEEADRARALRV